MKIKIKIESKCLQVEQTNLVGITDTSTTEGKKQVANW